MLLRLDKLTSATGEERPGDTAKLPKSCLAIETLDAHRAARLCRLPCCTSPLLPPRGGVQVATAFTAAATSCRRVAVESGTQM
ncbi:hypothetical protein BRADI_3g39045v3 [Brachypodium distachyon]|uniref:Uncharacterized protein n=1 Tax=Brachypodium distachyon TaxID=15368 RepID=A0A2K2D220_BRADI|nr:hypothetical protein BRADI_3g39045v3 [Brachypodium distachyon]